MTAHDRVSESGTHGIRRLVRQSIAAAVQSLGRGPLSDTAVHSLRKSLKRARALLRLLRAAIGDEAYRRENDALRDAARGFSQVRDSKVLLDTVEALIAHHRHDDELHRALRRDRVAARHELESSGSRIAATRQTLQSAYRRADRWHTDDGGWLALGTGLRHVYSRGREALRHARADGAPESFHEWRKQTKYLWHQLQALETLRPGTIGDLDDRAHTLSDLLGDDHNLTVLRARMERAELAEAVRSRLAGRIDSRQRSLRRRARGLGEQIYREAPAVFEARMARRWHGKRRRG